MEFISVDFLIRNRFEKGRVGYVFNDDTIQIIVEEKSEIRNLWEVVFGFLGKMDPQYVEISTVEQFKKFISIWSEEYANKFN